MEGDGGLARAVRAGGGGLELIVHHDYHHHYHHQQQPHPPARRRCHRRHQQQQQQQQQQQLQQWQCPRHHHHHHHARRQRWPRQLGIKACYLNHAYQHCHGPTTMITLVLGFYLHEIGHGISSIGMMCIAASRLYLHGCSCVSSAMHNHQQRVLPTSLRVMVQQHASAPACLGFPCPVLAVVEGLGFSLRAADCSTYSRLLSATASPLALTASSADYLTTLLGSEVLFRILTLIAV